MASRTQRLGFWLVQMTFGLVVIVAVAVGFLRNEYLNLKERRRIFP